jgi:hypothetical protein
VITLSLGQVATPDSASAQVNATVTSPVYQPTSFGLAVGAPVIAGAVRSILIPRTEADAELRPGRTR